MRTYAYTDRESERVCVRARATERARQFVREMRARERVRDALRHTPWMHHSEVGIYKKRLETVHLEFTY